MATSGQSSPPLTNAGDECYICSKEFRDCHCQNRAANQLPPQLNNEVSQLFANGQRESERIQLRKAMEQSKDKQKIQTILDFYASNVETLNKCLEKVLCSIEKEMGSIAKVYPFGSLVTSLSLKESDFDFYMEWTGSRPISPKTFFNRTNNILRRSKDFTDIFAIRNARVPIIRCKHKLTELRIDINMSNPSSIYNSNFVRSLMQRDSRLRELSLFIKIWAKKLNITGNGLTSYCLCVLVIYYLQQRNLLPSIKELQSDTPPRLLWGVNYGFNLNRMPDIPNNITTFHLISGFFKFYSAMEFESTVISPYLGYSLRRELAFASPSSFPEYQEQMLAIATATGQEGEAFQLDHSVAVQDPFKLGQNVAKSVSRKSLIYVKKCLVLAAEACGNENLLSQGRELYDYLLFGILETLKQNNRKKQSMLTTSNLNDVHSHVLHPCTNDIKALNLSVQMNILSAGISIYVYWINCYIDTIKDILIRIYGLEVKVLDAASEASLSYHKWQISTSRDTWKDRNFTHTEGTSFFCNQLQQTKALLSARGSSTVKLDGYFMLEANLDDKKLCLEVHPMPNDTSSMQKNGTLTRFFKSLKNFLANYSFKEKITIWKSLQSNQVGKGI